ncbi:MAG: hypothetical protein JWR11_449 [Mycobacterium sp.]|nr:hypothetical protein [Mycobacterium sp.]
MDLGDIFGGIFGGGSSSTSSTVTLNENIGGTDKPVNLGVGGTDKPLNLGVGGTDKPLKIDPLTVNENIDLKPVTVNENIGGTDKPINLGVGGTDKPLKIDPLTLNENIDLKPLAVDTCQTLKLAPLPDTSVCNPYRHRIAMQLWGFEVLTLAFNGETEQQIRSPRPTQHTLRTRREHSRPPDPRVVGRPHGISVRVIDSDD